MKLTFWQWVGTYLLIALVGAIILHSIMAARATPAVINPESN